MINKIVILLAALFCCGSLPAASTNQHGPVDPGIYSRDVPSGFGGAGAGGVYIPELVPSGSTIFVSQSGGSVSCGADGTQTTISVATLNSTAGDWVAGNIIKVCGNITSQIVADGSGASGNPWTVIFETGASATTTVWGSNGALVSNGHSHGVFDGGTGNAVISNTANGTGLANNQQSGAVFIQNGTDITVQNFVIQNICVRAAGDTGDSCTSGGNDTSAVELNGPLTNVTFQQNVVKMAGHNCVFYAGSGSDTGVLISKNTLRQCNWEFGVDGSTNGLTFDSNDVACVVGATCNWDDPADDNHHNGIIMFPGGSSTESNVVISNNWFHDILGNTTSYIFLDPSPPSGNVPNILVYNNVFSSATAGCPNDACFGGGAQVTGARLLNNTFSFPVSSSGLADWGMNNPPGTAQNNIALGSNFYVSFPSSMNTLTENFNDYFNGTGKWQGASGNFSTLAAWTAGSTGLCSGGCDATGSITTNPNLNSNFMPNSGSPVIGAGTNLTSLGITGLDQGAPQTFGVGSSCGTGCLSRLASGNWDMGAYPFVSGGGTVATPTFNPIAGVYGGAQSVTISTSTTGATLCYTTDGSTPTANGAGTCTHGTTYSGPVSVPSNLTIKAVGSLSGDTDSSVGTASYVINASPPAFAVGAFMQ